MNPLLNIQPFSKIRLAHGQMVADGTLERLFHPDRFVIVLKSSGLFNEPDMRFPVSDRMLASIELLPDGNFQLEF